MSKGRVYLLAGLFLFFVHCAANFPLSTILNWTNLRSNQLDWYTATGTIWGGTVEGVHLNGNYLGKLRQRSSLIALFTGKLSSKFGLTGGPAISAGKVQLSPWGDVTLTNTQLQLDLSRFNIRDAFDAPMRGDLEIRVKQLRLSRRGCKQADFEVWTNALVASAARYRGQGFDLAGQGRCEDGKLIIPISGQGAREAVFLDVEVDASLNYEAKVRVRSSTPDLVAALKLYGFDTNGEDLVMIQRGNFTIPR